LVQNFGARQRPSIRYADFRERRFPDVRLGPRRVAKIDPKRLRPGGDELKASRFDRSTFSSIDSRSRQPRIDRVDAEDHADRWRNYTGFTHDTRQLDFIFRNSGLIGNHYRRNGRSAYSVVSGHCVRLRYTVSGDQEGMAFIPTLNTQHPKIWPLFKWVALIFLAPLMVLAVIPILITTIAQLPVLGQVNFAFLGGTLASLPVVIRRQRRKPKEQALGGIAACTHIALSFTVIGCLFA